MNQGDKIKYLCSIRAKQVWTALLAVMLLVLWLAVPQPVYAAGEQYHGGSGDGFSFGESGETYLNGAATKVLVETAADGSGTVVPAQSITSGNSITVYAIARDASDNFVANVAADAWSLENITGGVVAGDLVPSGDGKSAVFTGHATGTAEIKATSGALATTNSGTLTVTAGGGGDGGGVTAQPEAVVTILGVGSIDLGPYLDAQGRTTAEISITSDDGLFTVIIPAGTQVLDAEGNVLANIEVIILHTPPPPPGYVLLGSAYDCLPDGAIFNPPITLTFDYDPADIPDGVNEEDLILAYWDGDNWNTLSTTVDAVANTVTAEVSHFTPFAILAYIGLATFSASDLSIGPAEVDIGEEVTISLLVNNTGDLAGNYEVALNIDGAVVATQEVTLAAGDSEQVTFTTAKAVAGSYQVSIDGLSGTFVVKEAVPSPPSPPAPAPPAPTPTSNWPLIGGIIGGVIVLGLIIFLLARRRAY